MSGCTCAIDVYVDCDSMATVAAIKIVKARKEYKCGECHGAIKPGEMYEHFRGLFDGRWESFRTCSTCMEIRSCLMCNWYYGGVWDEIDSWFQDDLEDIPICILDQLSPAARAELIGWIDDRIDLEEDE